MRRIIWMKPFGTQILTPQTRKPLFKLVCKEPTGLNNPGIREILTSAHDTEKH